MSARPAMFNFPNRPMCSDVSGIVAFKRKSTGTNPALFKKWWVPKSAPKKLESCERDVRTGGPYRLVFNVGDQTAEFFGK